MNRISTNLRRAGALLLPAAMAALWLAPAAAQYEEPSARYVEDEPGYDEVATDIVILSPQVLDELVAPLALYPDDLLAIALPASTYPLDIVEAARFLDKHERNKSLQPDEDWDESVIALLNYPEVVRMMNEDIDWTWQLGGAVLNQQPDVIEAVERFRDRAYAAGNLASDEHQTVSYVGDSIEIRPVDKEVIYVPYYEPREVVVRQVERVYYYYPRPRPVYYYPYPAGHYFFRHSFWGVSTAYRIGWSDHYLNVWHYSYRGHPYYGRRYAPRYYRQPTINIYNTRYVGSRGHYATERQRYGDRWRPRRDHGARPVSVRRPVQRYHTRPDAVAHDTARSANQRQGRDAALRSRDNRTARRESPDHREALASRGERAREPADRRGAARTAAAREQISFRERPERREQVNTRERSEAREQIRFRERPDTAVVNGRRGGQTDRAEDVRRQPERRVATSRREAVPERDVNRRDTQRRPVQRRAERAPDEAKSPARSERRPDNRADREEQRKPRADAKGRGESRNDRKPARDSGDRKRRQRD